METLIVIVAFWLILIGIYGAMPLLRAGGPRVNPTGAPRFAANPIVEAIQREVESRPAPVRPAPRRQVLPSFQPEAGDPYAEVSMLRAQIEHLRSELVALSSNSTERSARPRSRRSRTFQYTDLPRTLRRQVKEVRSVRRPSRV
ncbi:MAG TPA: hypothetical protein VJB57_03505 [Dehalococcoidia bacterium]|nr:hypothetical protein [Dehalococcoidia bacterium]